MAANPLDYYVGKGAVSIKLTGDNNYRDVGNVTQFEFTPEIEELEHFSSREGVRTLDRTVVLQTSGSLRMVMEEFSSANMAVALLGDVGSDGSGRDAIEVYSNTQITGAVRFVGSNDVGPQWQIDFPSVSFRPSSSINWLSDEWGTLEVTGKVAKEDGSFGTAVLLTSGSSNT